MNIMPNYGNFAYLRLNQQKKNETKSEVQPNSSQTNSSQKVQEIIIEENDVPM